MASQTGSRDTHTAGTRPATAPALVRPAAPVPGTRRRRGAAAQNTAGSVLPRYCDRKPPAMLDDGWVGETLNHADELETIESGDDFLIDIGDLEDSR